MIRGKKICSIAIATITWTAILLQLYLIILNRTVGIAETMLHFFGYFTILSNILVALAFTLSKKAQTFTAVTVYIVVVGVVYNLLLRKLWAPEGLQLLADNLLHTVSPILTALFWFIFVPKETLKWTDVFPWLLYPFAYCIFCLLNGKFFGFYAYPFVNAEQLGYPKVFLNCMVLALAFLILSLILVAIARIIHRTPRA